ncbi:CAAX amino terminal protease self- immunity [Streptomyces sp. YIM 130001]|uniref:CPBP family intramembrane glutamic endopeptidase n=1 Tax=Streptomyces sp. YIM 130001 TaxID=2259644 RepID=UPI000EC769B9|nr:CPBP family intramembrane glutamic endopeptidase [Streptomyces sp. YIM 130001]RII13135.1 CAAX amino terminal protease self- immunity [Streptomyces sp. YIM 130001]
MTTESGTTRSAALPTSTVQGDAPARTVCAGIAVVALGGLAVLPPSLPTAVRVDVLVAALSLTACTFLLRTPAAIRAGVFSTALMICFSAGALADLPPAVTTIAVCVVPPALLYAIGRRVLRLRPALSWLARGRLTREAPWLGLATVVVSGAALTTWALLARPEPAPFLRDLQDLPVAVALLGVCGFALVNPIWEEMLFRGVILTELASLWGAKTAAVLQALLFGAAHYGGFPSGVIGMIMAAGWGFVLGVMRLRSGGIAIPYLVHVTANAVIGSLAVFVLR